MSLKNKKFWQPSSVWNSSLYQNEESDKPIKVYEIIEPIDMHEFTGANTLKDIMAYLKRIKKNTEEYNYNLKNPRIINHSFYNGREYENEYYLVGERLETEEEYEKRQFDLNQKRNEEKDKKQKKEDSERKEFERLKQKFEGGDGK